MIFRKNTALLLFVIFVISTSPVLAGRCTGSSNCKACTSCSSCKHCNRDGGSCGVCDGGSMGFASGHSNSSGNKDTNWTPWIIVGILGGYILLQKSKKD
ncbi:hypothetical protein [Flavobacterium enshiense]|uniref:hypothetical protein n=1 Tax=Flavobacterium enshiense TaxID=1341165 RepID=UPI0009E08475|nr:hypothetical protein [Flavobacterium enshiense]